MACLGSDNRIQHNRIVAAGRVLHSGRNIHAADRQSVLLILHGTGSDGYVGEDVLHIGPILRIEHLICRSQTTFRNRTKMHLSHGDQTLLQIRLLLRVRLVHHTLIALPCGTRLICIDSRNQDQLILDLLLDLREAGDIIADGIFIISRTGTDDDKKSVRVPCNDIFDLFITFLFTENIFGRHRISLHQFLRRDYFLNKFEAHSVYHPF